MILERFNIAACQRRTEILQFSLAFSFEKYLLQFANKREMT